MFHELEFMDANISIRSALSRNYFDDLVKTPKDSPKESLAKTGRKATLAADDSTHQIRLRPRPGCVSSGFFFSAFADAYASMGLCRVYGDRYRSAQFQF
jgi:hypothetical protein